MSGGITDEMVERAAAVFRAEGWLLADPTPHDLDVIRDALEAALDGER